MWSEDRMRPTETQPAETQPGLSVPHMLSATAVFILVFADWKWMNGFRCAGPAFIKCHRMTGQKIHELHILGCSKSILSSLPIFRELQRSLNLWEVAWRWSSNLMTMMKTVIPYAGYKRESTNIEVKLKTSALKQQWFGSVAANKSSALINQTLISLTALQIPLTLPSSAVSHSRGPLTWVCNDSDDDGVQRWVTDPASTE